VAREERRDGGGTTRASRALRDGSGSVLVLLAIVTLSLSIWTLLDRDYLAAMLLSTVGLGVLRAAVSLLRPSIGE
jgi:hypothetical protein